MRIFIILFSALAITQCTSKESPSVATPKDSSWSEKMTRTAQNFQQILPYIYNEKEFTDPKNSPMIGEKIENFANSIHTLPSDQARKLIGDDPFLLASISQLKDIANRAKNAFTEGKKEHSQRLLKTASNHCFKCHTRMPYGPDSLYWKGLDLSKIQTSPLEKSQLYVSMRQYDNAKKEISTYLSSLEQMNKFTIDYENALKYYLMITLRGQNSAKQAQDFVVSKLHSEVINKHFKSVMKIWQVDLAFWQQKESSTPANLESAKAMLKRGGATMKNQFYSDENFVKRLIASSLLHQSLNTPSLTQPAKAESYFYLGSIYDSMVLASYWDLPELYFEMCIKYQPASAMARQCYSKLEENIRVGYSGSRGTFIPADEQQRLQDLKKIAF